MMSSIVAAMKKTTIILAGSIAFSVPPAIAADEVAETAVVSSVTVSAGAGGYFERARELVIHTLALIGVILACYGVGAVLYTFVVRRLLAALGQRGMVVYGGALCFSCYALIVLTPFWPVVVPCMFAVGFSFYMVHNTIQTKATEMAPQARGTGLSLFSASWALGQAVGVAVMGVLVSLFGIASSILAFSAGFLLLALWIRANLDRL